jgi:hypothetical protein
MAGKIREAKSVRTFLFENGLSLRYVYGARQAPAERRFCGIRPGFAGAASLERFVIESIFPVNALTV